MGGNKEEILQVIREQLADRGIDADKVTPDADLQADLGLDSLDVVELTTGIEERFGIEIPDSDLEGLATVGDATELIQQKVGAGA